MAFKSIPQNLDYLVLNDHLFQILQKNQQTRHLISMRAEEIVKIILSESLQSETHRKNKVLARKLNEIEQNYQKLQRVIEKIPEKQLKIKNSIVRQLKSQNQTILFKANTEIQNKHQLILNLQIELSRVQQSFSQLQQQHQKLVKDNIQKQQQIQKLTQAHKQNIAKLQDLQDYKQKSKIEMEKILFSHQQQMDKNFAKQRNLTNSLVEIQGKLNTANEEIEKITAILGKKQSESNEKCIRLQNELRKNNRQIEKHKKELDDNEQNYLLLKKEITKFKDKYKKFEEQYNSMRQTHSQEEKQSKTKIQNQIIEIQQLKNKVKQLNLNSQILSKHNNKIQKTIQKLKKHLSTSLVTLKQQNLTLKNSIKQNFILIRQYSQTSIMKLVNHISSQLSEYFQQCIIQIKKAREERSLAKQQVKIKADLIEHLDKMLNNQTKSVFDLRYELKHKIKDEEKLRKKLKNHYTETDKKLQEFQTKYISILKNQY